MASKQDENEDESDATILIRVYINRQCFETENIDTAQDVWKIAEIDRDNTEKMDGLREDIPLAFRKAKAFKALFKNEEEYEWKLYTYDETSAEVELEDSDDLQTEIDEFMPEADDADEDDDLMNQSKYLKIRVVFFKSMNYITSLTHSMFVHESIHILAQKN